MGYDEFLDERNLIVFFMLFLYLITFAFVCCLSLAIKLFIKLKFEFALRQPSILHQYLSTETRDILAWFLAVPSQMHDRLASSCIYCKLVNVYHVRYQWWFVSSSFVCVSCYILIFYVCFQEKLFSSKNRTEASVGKKLKIDSLPEIEKIHKVWDSFYLNTYGFKF